LEEIMRDECPQACDYDAHVEARHRAQREAEVKARRTAALALQHKAQRRSTTPVKFLLPKEELARRGITSLPQVRPKDLFLHLSSHSSSLHLFNAFILTRQASRFRLIFSDFSILFDLGGDCEGAGGERRVVFEAGHRDGHGAVPRPTAAPAGPLSLVRW
jgi:hypothetical protein